jgi:hypothetical protein
MLHPLGHTILARVGEASRNSGQRYAVVFREGDRLVVAGCLEVAEDRLRLAGGAGERARTLDVALTDIAEVRVGRRPSDRINGHRTLVLERIQLPPIEVAPLESGLLHELADLLGLLTSDAPGTGQTLAVVVPLKPGCLEEARRLLGREPPLDPSALGLTGHHVYLRDSEAVFVFEGPDVEGRVGRAMRNPALWRAGIAWQGCIAGRPHVDKHPQLPAAAETPVYTWTASGRAGR